MFNNYWRWIWVSIFSVNKYFLIWDNNVDVYNLYLYFVLDGYIRERKGKKGLQNPMTMLGV